MALRLRLFAFRRKAAGLGWPGCGPTRVAPDDHECNRGAVRSMKSMRKLIVSIHSTANDIVTGPPTDETNFMVWAQAGIEDSLETFLTSLANSIGVEAFERGAILVRYAPGA